MRLRDRWLFRSTSLTTVKSFTTTRVSFLTRFGRMLLRYTVVKLCASPRNSTWFTRPFSLLRGWGLWTRLSEQTLFWGFWEYSSKCEQELLPHVNLIIFSAFFSVHINCGFLDSYVCARLLQSAVLALHAYLLVSCPARVCLLVRNSLVNEVDGLITQNW